MRFLKFIGRFFSSILLNFAILVFIIGLSFTFVVGDGQTIKDSLKESNVYNEIISTALKEIEFTDSNGNDSDSDSLPIDDPEIQSIINESLPPDFLQSQTEGLLDDVFAWMDGSNKNLVFNIDLTKAKASFISGLSDYAVTRTENLPGCESVDLGTDGINVFNLECKPIGFSNTELKSQMESDLSEGDFLGEPVITQDNFSDDDGQSIEDKLEFVPKVYGFARNATLISVGLLFLVSMFYVSVRMPFIRGFQSLGRRLMSSSIIALIFAIVFKFFIPNITKSSINTEEGLSELATRVSSVFVDKLNNAAILGFGSIALVGAIILVVDFFVRRSNKYKLKIHKETRTQAKNKHHTLPPSDLKQPPPKI